MGTKIEIPTFDWFRRYKLLQYTAWVAFAVVQATMSEHFGEEKFKQFDGLWREPAFRQVGKKLVEKLGLKPDIEGVLKLLGTYGREIWGYGDPRCIEVIKEGPKRGVFKILICAGWERWSKSAGVNCWYGCAQEHYGVISALSPDFKVTLTKSRPRGDDVCEFVIEAKSAGA